MLQICIIDEKHHTYDSFLVAIQWCAFWSPVKQSWCNSESWTVWDRHRIHVLSESRTDYSSLLSAANLQNIAKPFQLNALLQLVALRCQETTDLKCEHNEFSRCHKKMIQCNSMVPITTSRKRTAVTIKIRTLIVNNPYGLFTMSAIRRKQCFMLTVRFNRCKYTLAFIYTEWKWMRKRIFFDVVGFPGECMNNLKD